MHPITHRKPADAQVSSSSLFGVDWYEVPVNAYGPQASFDVRADGSSGLRVTLARGTGRQAEESNGYAVAIETGASTAVTVSDSMRTIELDIAASATLAAVKNVVDADAALSSVYYGGESGTSMPLREATVTEYGSGDEHAFVEVVATGTSAVFVDVGPAQPDRNLNAAYAIRGERFLSAMKPGDLIWTKRSGGSNQGGHARLWRISRGQAAEFKMDV